MFDFEYWNADNYYIDTAHLALLNNQEMTMNAYTNKAQAKAHTAALRKYGIDLTVALNAGQNTDKAHSDYEAECASIGIDPNAEYDA